MEKYGTFIFTLVRALQEGIRVCENAEWHHLPAESERFHHFSRMVEVLSHAEERWRWWVDNQKAGRLPPEDTAAEGGVVRGERESYPDC